MTFHDARESLVYEALDRLAVSYDRFEHPAVATVQEATAYWANIQATHCKNLFLRNQKGDRQYLLVAAHDKRVDLRRVAEQIGDTRLSFGSPERLMAVLALTPGAVSPFGLLNDVRRTVRVLIDADLRDAAFVAFHPNVNTATVRLSREGFEVFLGSCGHVVQWVRL